MILSLGFLSSCSSDDDSGDGSSILGKWEFVKSGFIVNGIENYEDWEHDCATMKDHVDFKDNGKLYDHSYDTNCVVDTDVSDYVINGNTITVSFTAGGEVVEEVAKIETLNSTTLILKSDGELEGTSYSYVTVMKRM